jgi:hypothetical protein
MVFGFHGLLLGQNATSYGLHVDGVILRIIREDLDRIFQVKVLFEAKCCLHTPLVAP